MHSLEQIVVPLLWGSSVCLSVRDEHALWLYDGHRGRCCSHPPSFVCCIQYCRPVPLAGAVLWTMWATFSMVSVLPFWAFQVRSPCDTQIIFHSARLRCSAGHLSMRSHVQQTVSGCFVVIRQLRSIWQSVPSSVFQTLVVALVLTRLDYDNAMLAGLPAILLDHLQSVLNASAQSITGLCRSAHITDTLASFHWLRVHERIEFKLPVFVYRALHGTVPWYLCNVLTRVADVPSRSHLRSSTSSQLVVRPSRLVTIGDRSFASAGPRLWNSLPDDFTAAFVVVSSVWWMWMWSMSH